jgi:hypothetical protein
VYSRDTTSAMALRLLPPAFAGLVLAMASAGGVSICDGELDEDGHTEMRRWG